MQIKIEEIPTTEIKKILPLIQKLNPHLDKTIIAERLQSMISHGYHCAGLYVDKELAGISGFWIGEKFYCGKYIELDNVFIDEQHRSKQLGDKLTKWLEAYGKEVGCNVAMLDAYVTNTRAHKFYTRNDYTIIGYHFSKDL